MEILMNLEYIRIFLRTFLGFLFLNLKLILILQSIHLWKMKILHKL